jgi:hypothetical protein
MEEKLTLMPITDPSSETEIDKNDCWNEKKSVA